MTRRIVMAAMLALLAVSLGAQIRENWPPTPLLVNATTTGAGVSFTPVRDHKSFQARGQTTAGAGSVTVIIEVSNVQAPGANDWITAGTIVLTLSTTTTTDGFAMTAAWHHVRARVSAISGTGAAVSADMGS